MSTSKKYKSNSPEYRKQRYTGIYGSWLSMKQRCDNPNHASYHNYGGRGVSYDPLWKDITAFKADMENSYKKGMTLDRIDVNGNYTKKNCQWIPKSLQAHNMRKTVWIEFNGKKQTLMAWAKELGLNYGTVKSRYYRGMSLKQILKPKLYRPRKL